MQSSQESVETRLVDSQESDISVAAASQSSNDVDTSSETSSDDAGDMEWKTDVKLDGISVHDFDDTGCGPTHNLGLDAGPLDYFALFYDTDFVAMIVTETNR